MFLECTIEVRTKSYPVGKKVLGRHNVPPGVTRARRPLREVLPTFLLDRFRVGLKLNKEGRAKNDFIKTIIRIPARTDNMS